MRDFIPTCCRSQDHILNLHIGKNRDAPDDASQAAHYAFFVRENMFVELDFKGEEESRADFQGFARAQEIFELLVAKETYRG